MEMTRNCAIKMEKRAVKFGTSTNLLQISDLSGQVMCSYLPRSSLLTLRVVCRRTRSWVESQRILTRIPIELKYSRQLQRVMQSTVPWNNFCIDCGDLDGHTNLQKLIDTFGHRIRILKIKAASGYRKKIEFLLQCPKLESVDIGDIDFRQVSPVEFDTLLRHFENLKELRLRDIYNPDEKLTEMVMRMVTRSSKLVTLKLPIFRGGSFALPASMSPTPEPIPKPIDLWNTKVIQPLIKYLELRHKQSPTKPNLKYLDIDGLVGFLSDFNLSSFQALVEACGRCDTHLTNVSEFLFTKFNPSLSESSFGIIHSVDGFHENIDFNRMRNLKKLKVTLTPMDGFAGAERDIFDYGFELSNLESLDVTFMFDVDADPIPAKIKGLFQTPRFGVKTLKITWNLQKPKMVIDVRDLVRKFPNVRKLELIGCPGRDEEFNLIFGGMTFLEDLKIKDCRHITDNAFLGSHPKTPAHFLQLKQLKRLWIRAFRTYDIGCGITDRSFLKAFANMPIHHFTFTTIGPTNISLDGLKGLNKDPFRNTIEYMTMTKPISVPDWEIRRISRAFNNLKRMF